MRFDRLLIYCLVPAVSLAVSVVSGGEYTSVIRPILAKNCFACHGTDEEGRQADLRLDTFDGATADLGGYAAIVPGSADESELILRVEETDEYVRMPPPESGHSVSAEEIAALRRWIEGGAEYEAHWAFTQPAHPKSEPSIDRFVRERLGEVGLELSIAADRRTLARRLSLDLRGLPPTPAEVDAFVRDPAPDAYERFVDRLLADPATAERLASDWLDTARYADTNGFSIDDGRFMWVWRDWVIKAFADNLPYDEFITRQLAGDLLPNAGPQEKLATGFLRCGMNTHEGGALPEEYRVISIADKVDAAATAFMGITMKCAQCHDHKYDPISQRDYYRFYALFDTTTEPGHGATNGNTEPTLFVEPPLQQSWREGLEARLADLARARREPPSEIAAARDAWEADPGSDDERLLAAISTLRSKRTDADWELINNAFAERSKAMRDHLNSVAAEEAAERKQFDDGLVSTMVMDHDPTRTTRLLTRGQYDQPADKVTPGVPTGLGPEAKVEDRLGLARWLTRPDHPLTSRVAVNRFWQLIFGRGLVETSEDFGVRAELPTHPELLDWLAIDFVESGWDVRRLLKKMVTSDTYRQSAVATPAMLSADQENRLLSRSSCRRLPAEFVRDNALAVSGLLHRAVGGPPVLPPQPEGLWREVSHYGHPTEYFTAQSYHPSRDTRRYRRSLNLYWKRTSPPPTLATFDAPTRETCQTRRGMTTTPLQALTLWNEPQFVAAARALADRSMRGTDEAPLERMFRLALGRMPDEHESKRLLDQLDLNRQHFETNARAAAQLASINSSGSSDAAAWTLVASTIINLHEFNSRP